jgi:hypothetical protein
VPGPVFLQRFLGPVVHARHQAHEHLGRVVQRLGDLAAQQGCHQRQALALGELVQLAIRHIRERSFCRGPPS